MNFKSVSALVIAAAAAGSAFAETPGGWNANELSHLSTKARAEVQAELFAYKKAGVNPWSTQYNPLAQFRSTTDRAAVTAAYVADRDAVAAINSEDGGSSYFAFGHTQPGYASQTLAGQPAAGQ